MNAVWSALNRDDGQVFVISTPHTGKAPTTKSLSTAVVDVEERVSAKKLEKHGGVEPLKTAVMLMPPSKKLNCGKVPGAPDFGVYGQGAAVGSALLIAHASSPVRVGPHLAAFSFRTSCMVPPFWSPPEPTHSSTWIVVTAPPFEKFASTRRSPTWWTPLNEPFGLTVMFCWKNQKPSWASPSLAKRSAPK